MNDFEQKLSRQPLRTPPPEWRAEILGAAQKLVVPAWTWRDWFWPSPAAWGALAAVWIAVFALGRSETSSTGTAPGSGIARASASAPLYAFQPRGDINAFLESLP